MPIYRATYLFIIEARNKVLLISFNQRSEMNMTKIFASVAALALLTGSC